MNGHIYQNLLANSPRISGRLARQPNRYFNSRFFAVWFAIFFAAFFGLYALGLVPAGVSEIGDAIVYDIGFVSKSVAGLGAVLNSGAEISKGAVNEVGVSIINAASSASNMISGLGRTLSFDPGFITEKSAKAISVVWSSISSIKLPDIHLSLPSIEKKKDKGINLKAEISPSLAVLPAIEKTNIQFVAFDAARIIIPAIEVDAPIVFPKSADIDVLNDSLLKGIVHYPGSALPGEKGSVFLSGHSTGLTIVHNKSFEVFNRLKDLKTGDIVQIQSGNQEYRYRVLSMKIAKVDGAVIDLNSRKEKLILSTCRIFGRDVKDDRFVVEAEFMGKYPLSS